MKNQLVEDGLRDYRALMSAAKICASKAQSLDCKSLSHDIGEEHESCEECPVDAELRKSIECVWSICGSYEKNSVALSKSRIDDPVWNSFNKSQSVLLLDIIKEHDCVIAKQDAALAEKDAVIEVLRTEAESRDAVWEVMIGLNTYGIFASYDAAEKKVEDMGTSGGFPTIGERVLH